MAMRLYLSVATDSRLAYILLCMCIIVAFTRTQSGNEKKHSSRIQTIVGYIDSVHTSSSNNNDLKLDEVSHATTSTLRSTASTNHTVSNVLCAVL
jgi:hypothetical protein